MPNISLFAKALNALPEADAKFAGLTAALAECPVDASSMGGLATKKASVMNSLDSSYSDTAGKNPGMLAGTLMGAGPDLSTERRMGAGLGSIC